MEEKCQAEIETRQKNGNRSISEMETRKSKCHREMSMSEVCIVHCLRDRVTDDLHFINKVYSEIRQEVG